MPQEEAVCWGSYLQNLQNIFFFFFFFCDDTVLYISPQSVSMD